MFRVKIWGARGSLPAPHTPAQIEEKVRDLLTAFAEAGHTRAEHVEDFLKAQDWATLGGFGGNTTCVEAQTDAERVIIDGGTGLRLLGYELMSGPCGKGKGVVHLFMTHFHWDHLMGIPFFTPLFIPGNKIHVYSVQPDAEKAFHALFSRPFFPLGFDKLGAKVIFHRLEPRQPKTIADMTFTPYQLDHPDPCWGFRIESQGRVYAHCVDTEATRMSREELGPDLPLYQNVDVALFDAQYTLMEAIEKVNWGHAAATLGLDLALREGIKKIYFVHHDPASSDSKVAAAEEQARKYLATQYNASRRTGQALPPVEWSFARDGMVIDI